MPGYNPPRANEDQRMKVGAGNASLLENCFGLLSKDQELLKRCVAKGSLSPLAMPVFDGKLQLGLQTIRDRLTVIDDIIRGGEDCFLEMLHGANLSAVEQGLFLIMLRDRFVGSKFVAHCFALRDQLPVQLQNALIGFEGNKETVALTVGSVCELMEHQLDLAPPVTKAAIIQAHESKGLKAAVDNVIPSTNALNPVLLEAAAINVGVKKTSSTWQKIKNWGSSVFKKKTKGKAKSKVSEPQQAGRSEEPEEAEEAKEVLTLSDADGSTEPGQVKHYGSVVQNEVQLTVASSFEAETSQDNGQDSKLTLAIKGKPPLVVSSETPNELRVVFEKLKHQLVYVDKHGAKALDGTQDEQFALSVPEVQLISESVLQLVLRMNEKPEETLASARAIRELMDEIERLVLEK